MRLINDNNINKTKGVDKGNKKKMSYYSESKFILVE